MNIILWVVFYTISTTFLLYFFLKEKQVVEFIRGKEDKILKKVYSESQKKDKNNLLGNIITVISIIITVIFFFIVDRTPDFTIKIKNWGIYGVFAINIIFYVLRKEHEWIFLLNLVMMFWRIYTDPGESFL